MHSWLWLDQMHGCTMSIFGWVVSSQFHLAPFPSVFFATGTLGADTQTFQLHYFFSQVEVLEYVAVGQIMAIHLMNWTRV